MKDATTEDLLEQQTSRIQQMAKLDTLFKKNPSSTKTCTQNMFLQVSSLFIFLKYFSVCPSLAKLVHFHIDIFTNIYSS